MDKKSGGKRRPDDYQVPKRLLVPVDFSTCSLAALNYALMLSKLSGASILLVHIVEPLHPGSLLEGPEIRRLHDLARRQAEDRLVELLRTKVSPICTGNLLVRPGKPFEVIVNLAKKSATDLIIMGTRGDTNVPKILLGSTTKRVAHRAHCPVLIVRDNNGG